MKKYITLLASLLIVATACHEGEVDKVLPRSNGTHNELMLVIDDYLWDGSFGDYVKDYLEVPVSGLPTPEPLFMIHQVDRPAFNDFFIKYKSIFQLAVIPDSSSFVIAYDHWASPQVVISMIAPTESALREMFAANHERVIETLQKHDRRILLNRIQKSTYAILPAAVQKMGIKSMELPEAFNVTQSKDSLVILYAQYRESDQYIFIHTRTMNDDIAPGSDMVSVRDTILKYDFEGPSEGSYPGTELRIAPTLNPTTIDGKMAFELRGLWRTYNDFMGGAFLSYAIYDDVNNRIVTVESFMFGPTAKKYKVMQELEVVLRSVKLN